MYPKKPQRYRNYYKSLLEAGTKNGYINESQQGSPTTSARTAMEQAKNQIERSSAPLPDLGQERCQPHTGSLARRETTIP